MMLKWHRVSDISTSFCADSEKIAHIDTEDLSKIEDVLEHVASSKQELRAEVEELKALKEDIEEYQEVGRVLLNSAKLLIVLQPNYSSWFSFHCNITFLCINIFVKLFVTGQWAILSAAVMIWSACCYHNVKQWINL